MIPIVAVVAVLLVAGIGFAMASSGPKPSQQPVQHSPKSSNALTENTANRISPIENIVVSDLKLEEDPVKRYILTGKVANTSNETYTVKIRFSATEHSSDKYGEETTESVSLDFDDGNVTGYTEASGNTLKVYDLAPTEAGQEFAFTLYPRFDSIEEFLSDPVCEVVDATLPDAQADWRFDYDGGIEIKDQKLTADGMAVIDIVNNTNLYLESTTVRFVCYNSQNIPAVNSNFGDRPCGAVVKQASLQTLKPGDSGSFECEVGEGYSKVEILDTTIVPDTSKNSFN